MSAFSSLQASHAKLFVLFFANLIYLVYGVYVMFVQVWIIKIQGVCRCYLRFGKENKILIGFEWEKSLNSEGRICEWVMNSVDTSADPAKLLLGCYFLFWVHFARKYTELLLEW